MHDKRKEQLEKTWIANVVRIQDKTKEEAKELYNKIKPYDTKYSLRIIDFNN